MYVEYVATIEQFLRLKADARKRVDFEISYVDMAKDLIAGLLLSQIVYWFYEPGKNGLSKLRIMKQGTMWLAKQQSAWWDEIRLSPKQVRRALKILVGKGLITIEYYRFSGIRTTHIRINHKNFVKAFNDVLNDSPKNPYKKNKDPGE